MKSLPKNAATTRWLRRLGAMAFGALLVSACSSESPPSKGNIGVLFPSTAAAVATDYLQFFVFDGPSSEAERPTLCQDLIQARKKGDTPSPGEQSPPIHVCDALEGAVPVTIPYGEHAVLVLGQRNGKDFLVGCTLQTFGKGDAVLPVSLSLINASASLPSKTCPSLSDFCSEVCTPN